MHQGRIHATILSHKSIPHGKMEKKQLLEEDAAWVYAGMSRVPTAKPMFQRHNFYLLALIRVRDLHQFLILWGFLLFISRLPVYSTRLTGKRNCKHGTVKQCSSSRMPITILIFLGVSSSWLSTFIGLCSWDGRCPTFCKTLTWHRTQTCALIKCPSHARLWRIVECNLGRNRRLNYSHRRRRSDTLRYAALIL